MSAYEYMSELNDVVDVSAPIPNLASSITQSITANTYQNAPGLPGNTENSEHRVKKVVKVWTCARQHPTSALIGIRPGVKFEQSFQCQTREGSAVIYDVTVDGVLYRGKGTKAGLAKAIAAYHALVGMKANGVQLLQKICDIEKEEETVVRRLALFVKQEAEKAEKLQKRQQEHERMLSRGKRIKTNDGAVKMGDTWNQVRKKYGPDVVSVWDEMREDDKPPIHQCTLKVQGIPFVATSTTKAMAGALAAKQALDTLAEDPPPHVNERKRKVPTPFVQKVPVYFPDQLPAMCWHFVDTLIKDKHPAYVKRRNMVCIVKVDGLDNVIEKCSVVAVGCGTVVIDLPNMTTDGTVINDCTGEALAVRAFRKYLLAQISKATSSTRTSCIFSKDRSGKLILAKDTRFFLHTNSCPMGDARYFGILESEVESTPRPEGEPMVVAERYNDKRRIVKKENMGKIQVFQSQDSQGAVTENLCWLDNDDKEQHCIKSPSDKLLVRNMAGFQGALNSTLISPVYISEYYIRRAYNEEALKRGLYDRASGASKLAGPAPGIYETTWKAIARVESASLYAFVWCEGEQLDILKTNIGKSIPQLRPVKGATPYDSEAFVKTLQSEVAQAKPSPYCTANFYKSFVNVCKSQGKIVGTYVETKQSAQTYNIIKTSVYNKLEMDGKGKWPEKPIKPNF